MYSQTRVKAALFGGARASERRLGHSVVLGIEVVDNRVTGICGLRGDCQWRQGAGHDGECLQLLLD